MKHVYGVIMAGGVGKRFRPLSRTERPKQFIDILGTGKTFIQQTYERLAKIIPPDNIIIVTGEDYRALVAAQLPQVCAKNVLCEPIRRNTAPCIAYAAYKLREIDPQAVMVVAPSDHHIANETEFAAAVKDAVRFAQENDSLVTIGVKPTRAETGYGYIQVTEGADAGTEMGICKVKTFTEKPNKELADIFFASGEFYWNSGMFIWAVGSIIRAMETHLSDIARIFSAGIGSYNTADETKFIEKAYAQCKSISIDYGVMEKVDNAYVICANFDWSDIGSWTSLYLHFPKDANGNVIRNNNIVMQNVSNSMIRAAPEKLVVVQDLDNFLVIDIDDVLLICPRSNAEDAAGIVDMALLERKMGK
jgi:mannose-1-phosphate guanylyltransferase